MAINRHSFVAFYPSDWLGGTARMTRMHKSIYFDVCCYIWDQNRPCPPAELPLMLGDLPDWRSYVEDLVAAGKLIRNDDGSLTNPKAAEEAEKAFSLWERKSAGGKRGAAKTNTPAGSADGSPAGSGGGSSQKTAGSADAEPEPEPEPELELEEDDVDAGVRKPDPFGDVAGLAARCGRASGVAVTPNSTKFADQLDTVRAWIGLGLDPDTEIIPALEQDAADSTEDRYSLNYFNPMMHRIAARKDARTNGKRANTKRNGDGDMHASPASAILAARDRLRGRG
jgi:hypothetical protein